MLFLQNIVVKYNKRTRKDNRQFKEKMSIKYDNNSMNTSCGIINDPCVFTETYFRKKILQKNFQMMHTCANACREIIYFLNLVI